MLLKYADLLDTMLVILFFWTITMIMINTGRIARALEQRNNNGPT